LPKRESPAEQWQVYFEQKKDTLFQRVVKKSLDVEIDPEAETWVDGRTEPTAEEINSTAEPTNPADKLTKPTPEKTKPVAEGTKPIAKEIKSKSEIFREPVE
jgi:hypothetical protein